MSVNKPSGGSGASPLGEHIQSLALNSASPLMRTVTQEIEAIELALARGISYRQIAAAIGGQEGAANPKTLRECVYRVRKRRATGLAAPRPAAPRGVSVLGSGDVSPAMPAPGFAKAQGDDVSQPLPEPVSELFSTPVTERVTKQVSESAAPQAASSSLFAAPATDPEVITRIRSSMPDLDMLAWQFRESQRKASTAAAPIRHPWTPSGGPSTEHQPTEPGEHST